ncbi:M1 family metallopeptidase [Amycolatopsis sp. cmx-8-4]|uniref:M1 family metallopeptidase n=1 Tax=Amycolatopsis sp. cmx-8-4 TaxID=2790947 RepID=UPI00397AA090
MKRVATLAVMSALTVLATTTPAVAAPAAGALSLGDRLYPALGNGGYDATSYDVGYDYRPGVTTMTSSITMRARATQALSSFGLDSAGQQITGVTVNGRQAAFRTQEKKLIVTPDRPLTRGLPFTVRVDYVADRSKNPASPAVHLPPGTDWPIKAWVNTPDGFAFMGQPDRAHLFFPSNDHPSDKAVFTFRITTPVDTTAVANGTLVSRRTDGDRTTFVYRTAHPIPTDVTQVAVGRFHTIDQTGPHGLPIRSYITNTGDPSPMDDAARRTPGQVTWLEQAIGRPFPFERYGVLAVDSDYNGVALENPTLSTFSRYSLADTDEHQSPVMVHEITHQYFGDTVSVHNWDDMWLSEGHAMYYTNRYDDARGFRKMDDVMKDLCAADAETRSTEGPAAHLKSPAGVLFGTDAPGALTLYGLHNLVGPQTFRRIEQTFYDTFRGRSASTQDYVDVASKVSGKDLTDYFKSWLHGDTTPPMPGHPDWTSAAKP